MVFKLLLHHQWIHLSEVFAVTMAILLVPLFSHALSLWLSASVYLLSPSPPLVQPILGALACSRPHLQSSRMTPLFLHLYTCDFCLFLSCSHPSLEHLEESQLVVCCLKKVFRVYFQILFLCLCGFCVCVCRVIEGAYWGQDKVTDLILDGVSVIMCCSAWVLGTKLWSSGSTIIYLDHKESFKVKGIACGFYHLQNLAVWS